MSTPTITDVSTGLQLGAALAGAAGLSLSKDVQTGLQIVTALLGTAAALQTKIAAGTITAADNSAALADLVSARDQLAADITKAEAEQANTTPVGTPPAAS